MLIINIIYNFKESLYSLASPLLKACQVGMETEANNKNI